MASAAPSSAKDKQVGYTSSDLKVAEVSQNGTITAKAPGAVKITVAAKDGGGAKAVCTVTVKTASVKLNASKAPLQKKKSSAALKVIKLEQGDQITSWTSDQPKIVSVSANGKMKAGSKTGKANITVQTKFGAKAVCTVTVQKNKVKLKSFSISSKNKVVLKEGKKLTLAINKKPITAEEKLMFTSSSSKVASVTKKGVVTAKKKGTCKITVKSKSGKKKGITVTVK